MESGDLCVTLGLSFYKSDLQNIEWEISNKCKEWNSLNVATMDGFCIFKPYLGN